MCSVDRASSVSFPGCVYGKSFNNAHEPAYRGHALDHLRPVHDTGYVRYGLCLDNGVEDGAYSEVKYEFLTQEWRTGSHVPPM
jgi:hypothetical protein